MNEKNSAANERLSALVDGHLQGDALAVGLNALLSDPQSMQTWHAFHVVGDVLRSAELAPSNDDLAFWHVLEARLAQEPLMPAFADVGDRAPLAGLGAQETHVLAVSANASLFKWRLVAGLACTAFVAVGGLGLWGQTAQPGSVQMSQSAPTPQTIAVDPNRGNMIRDPRLDALMAAHQQLGGHSALQVPAGFLRDATYERPAR